jgi:hypothetical protein
MEGGVKKNPLVSTSVYRGLWVFRCGRRGEEGSSYIVTRSRVHFAACIDPVVFFLLLSAAVLRDLQGYRFYTKILFDIHLSSPPYI